jgi:dUTP pyrophosphatase
MKIKLLSEGAKVPTKGSNEAAGYDLYVPKDTIIYPGRNVVPLDFAMSLDKGKHAHIRPRSGFSAKGIEGHCINESFRNGFDPVEQRLDADVIQGTVDSDYRNSVGVIIKSFETKPFVVTAGTRIAQMVILEHSEESIIQVDELDNTERGTGGFGSTGTH